MAKQLGRGGVSLAVEGSGGCQDEAEEAGCEQGRGWRNILETMSSNQGGAQSPERANSRSMCGGSSGFHTSHLPQMGKKGTVVHTQPAGLVNLIPQSATQGAAKRAAPCPCHPCMAVAG